MKGQKITLYVYIGAASNEDEAMQVIKFDVDDKWDRRRKYARTGYRENNWIDVAKESDCTA